MEEIVAKLQADETLLAEFDEKPAVVLEKLLGVELPDDQVKQLVDTVKAKLKLDNVGDALAGRLARRRTEAPCRTGAVSGRPGTALSAAEGQGSAAKSRPGT